MAENFSVKRTEPEPKTQHEKAAAELARQRAELEKLKKLSRYDAAAKDVASKKARRDKLIKGFAETKY